MTAAQTRTPESRLNLSPIPALDGVRALAVFLVVFYHFGFDAVPGDVGVTIFFVLSGFLITTLLLKENDRTGTVRFSAFYRRRMLRIFPAFYAYWLISVGITILRKRPMDWGPTISAFFYASNYYLGLVRGHSEHFLAHTWSLAIEEQFYLLWPCVFWLLRKDLKRLTWALAAIIVTVWIYRAALCLAFNVTASYLYHAFDTRADHLMIGCLTAVLVKRGALRGFIRAACASSWLPAIASVLLAVAIFLPIPGHQNQYKFAVSYAIQPVLIALLILQLVVLSDTRAWGWIENPALKFLGRISYPIYLWQALTLATARRLTEAFPVVVQLAFAVAVTIAVAWASYQFVEKPFLKMKDREGAVPQPGADVGPEYASVASA
jgi:peptidoglycan/LPS O-acetylase OafA/YrhL